MRRTLATVLVAFGLSISVLPAVAATAAHDGLRPPSALDPADTALVEARQALTVASEALDGPTHGSPTLALRDLFVALLTLTGEDRATAQGLLARPTQGDGDPNGDGYTVPAKSDCSRLICMHWVSTTRDAPPSRSWVDKNMAVMKKTWRREVSTLGYRRPLTDGGRGGSDKFDVYLKDVGSEGYYGYCVPEQSKRSSKWLASGYCVLDDDFARSQFGTKPMAGLRVTAAHEFFHAIQFAYDYGEDRWLMEATATWMEERVADDVNDNRQYLRHGQVAQPAHSLDYFDPSAFDQYGNWAFFEFLSRAFGVDTIRTIWRQAGAFEGAPDLYSTRAVKSALPRDRSWISVFRAYAAANTIPGRSYAEGSHWPRAPSVALHTLGPTADTAAGTLRVDHMAAKNLTVRPGDKLKDRSWAIRVSVDGPRRRTGPGAFVIVHKAGGAVVRKPIGLDRNGAGATTFRFDTASVKKATVTLANGSTRFNCWEQTTTYSCQGDPRDDAKQYAYTLKVFQR